MEFKPGDKVKVRAGCKAHFLEYDTVYTIELVEERGERQYVSLKEYPQRGRATLYAYRFELALIPEINLVNHPEYKELFT